MPKWGENKYKDESPLKTIHKIRGILSNLGIVTIENCWKNSVKGYYSVSLSIPNTILRSNGKGTSHEYALASAYGEMMERLQNLATFRLGMDFKEDVYKYKNFYYAPDEKKISMQYLLEGKDDWIRSKYLQMTEQPERLLHKWIDTSYEKISDDFIALPYFNVNTKQISYIPIKMVCKMYMSNGMCAGNTTEEALIQGISETFERYVNKKILNENITPPTIPKTYLYNYPHICSMIESIECSGIYKVIVKDCSLGEGYPVVCVIFIDQQTQRYFIKFGSFPKFDIALERTLTELLQGQELQNMKGLTEFNYNLKVEDKSKNLIGILVNGSGYYPKEIFYDTPSYNWNTFDRFDGKNNKELLKQLIDFIEEKGFNLYIRDVSFLGFTAYHAVISNLSEIQDINDTNALDKYIRYNNIKRLIRNLQKLKNKGIKELINLFEKGKYHPLIPIIKFLNMEVDSALPWYFDNVSLFLLVLNCKIKNYKNASKVFDKYLDNMGKNSYSLPICTYYRCIKQYLDMRSDNKTNDEIINLMEKFYTEDMIKKVFLEFDETIILGKNVSTLQCFKCDECTVHSSCRYIETEKIYKILKEQYANNPIEQVDLSILKKNNN